MARCGWPRAWEGIAAWSHSPCTRMSACLLPFRIFSATIIQLGEATYQATEEYAMRKERTTFSITKRKTAASGKAEQRREDLPMAQIIRRALDIYLAWNDPSY